MADRNLVVRLKAEIADFKAKFEQAGKASTDLANRLEKSQGSLDKLSGFATKGGLAIAAGLGLAAKAAIDWESAWAGVTKTVDGSSEQLAALEGSLRQMARTMPATHSEIAAVAEAAGQLGVRTEDVAGFTRTMIDLGETTNLTADEAATSLAQFMNVMGTSADDVSRLGSAVVDLGNKGASTERDIVQMGQRIAAAGKAAGMSETDVLGFASALASVGVEAEAGGTAVSMTFMQLGKAVREGSDSLDLIARTAGMSADQYSKAWGEDAAGATQAFIEGLGRMQAGGEDAQGVLEALGMTGIRQTDSIMRLAQANSLLGDNLSNAASAWDANSALADEAAKRYETTESKIRIAWNNIKDAAIDAGAAMLPTIASIAEGAAALAEGFAAIPQPVKTAGVSFAALAAGGLLAVGGITKLVSTGLELRSVFRDLSAASPKLAEGFKGAGKAAGIFAGAMAAITVAQVITDMNRMTVTLGDADAALRKLGQGKGDLDDLFNFDSVNVKNLDDALRSVSSATSGWDKVRGDIQAVAGLGGDIQQSREQFAQFDQALAQMDGASAAAAFEQISQRAAALGIPMSDLAAIFPEYARVLQESANASGGTATAAEALTGSIDRQAAAAESAAAAQSALIGQMRELANAALQLSGSEIGLEAAIDSATAAAEEHGRTLDINTEAGRANRSALDAIASSALALRDSQLNAGASSDQMRASTERARAEFIRVARQMGSTEEQANALADQYHLIPDQVSTLVTAPGATMSAQQTADFQRRLDALPAEKRAQIQSIFNRSGYDAAINSLNAIDGKTATTYIRTVRQVVDGNAAMTSRGNMLARAYGGPLPGYAPHDRADNVNYWGTPGEWVIQRPTVRYYGDDVMADLNAAKIPRESLRAALGYASGGQLGMQPAGYSTPSPRALTYSQAAGDSRTYIYGDVLDWRAVERVERSRQTRIGSAQTAAGIGMGAAL